MVEVPPVEPHAEDDAEWATGKEADDVPPRCTGSELEKNQVRHANAQAVDEGGNVMSSIHKLALQAQCEDENEGAAEKSEWCHHISFGSRQPRKTGCRGASLTPMGKYLNLARRPRY